MLGRIKKRRFHEVFLLTFLVLSLMMIYIGFLRQLTACCVKVSVPVLFSQANAHIFFCSQHVAKRVHRSVKEANL